MSSRRPAAPWPETPRTPRFPSACPMSWRRGRRPWGDVPVLDPSFPGDEPAALGGTDTAANPVEYALAALGSCQVITYQFWAAKLGIPLESVRVNVHGDLDLHGFFGFSGTRPGFTGVRVTVDLGGPASAEQYDELKRQVDEACPGLG